MAKLDRGELPELAPPKTVEDLVPEFMQRKRESKRVLSTNTIDFYEEILDRRLMPTFGKLPIARVSDKGVEAYVAGRLADDLSPVTVQGEVDAFAHLLDLAIEKKIIKVNPARGIEVEGIRDERPKEWLHTPEITIFLGFCSTTFYPKAFAAIFLGLRRGEVIVVQWGDFDFDHDVLLVRNKPEFKFRTKYGRSRSIPLWPEVKEYFLRRWEEMGRPGPEALVFPNTNGGRYSLDTRSFAKATAEAVKRAGITRPVTKFHDLRRTFGSLCLEARVPLEVVAEWLGHRSVETTRQVYARISGLFSSEQMGRVGEYWQRKRAEQGRRLPSLPVAVCPGEVRAAEQNTAVIEGSKESGAANGCGRTEIGCGQAKVMN